ncbi:MAG: PilZ domain-containing protein [Lachnospiraceae bacterium]|nr:PilZ domain-containing protein [Lachnospiraceae bacterium]
MGIKLSEIEEGSPISLQIYNSENKMQMGAVLKQHVKENIVLISLEYDTTRKLNFDNVRIDMEYTYDDGVPIIWRNVRVVNYREDYAMQVFSDGSRHNRRGCFRVSVAMNATLSMVGRTPQQITVRDLSLSGFSISDRKKELGLSVGDRLEIKFEDMGHYLDLKGKVVRIQEEEDMIIYGLETYNLCKDLSSYISLKQRRKGNK